MCKGNNKFSIRALCNLCRKIQSAVNKKCTLVILCSLYVHVKFFMLINYMYNKITTCAASYNVIMTSCCFYCVI